MPRMSVKDLSNLFSSVPAKSRQAKRRQDELPPDLASPAAPVRPPLSIAGGPSTRLLNLPQNVRRNVLGYAIDQARANAKEAHRPQAERFQASDLVRKLSHFSINDPLDVDLFAETISVMDADAQKEVSRDWLASIGFEEEHSFKAGFKKLIQFKDVDFDLNALSVTNFNIAMGTLEEAETAVKLHMRLSNGYGAEPKLALPSSLAPTYRDHEFNEATGTWKWGYSSRDHLKHIHRIKFKIGNLDDRRQLKFHDKADKIHAWPFKDCNFLWSKVASLHLLDMDNQGAARIGESFFCMDEAETFKDAMQVASRYPIETLKLDLENWSYFEEDGQATTDAICALISKAKADTISFVGLSCDDEQFQHIMDSLHNAPCTRLDLRGVELTSDRKQMIADMLPQSNLVELHMDEDRNPG